MSPKRLKRILPFAAPILSAVLLVAGFPFFNIYLLPWVALVPLFFALQDRRPAARALIAYAFGVCFFGILFYWFCHARSPAWIGYVLFLLVIPVIFIPWGLAAGWALDRKSNMALLIPALGWVALELAMSYGMFAFPWWSLAVSQSENLVVIQMASLTGMYGISFFVVMSNVIILKTLTGGARRHIDLFYAIGALFTLCLVYGALALFHKPEAQAKPVHLAMVQPSYAQEDKLDAIEGDIYTSIQEMHDTFWNMSVQAAAEKHPDIIIWPESALPVEWLLDERMNPLPQTGLRLKMLDATLITGAFIDKYNSVIALTPQGNYLGRYDKMQLVPGGEFIPWRKELSGIPALGDWFDSAVYQEDTARGARRHIFNTPHGRIGAVICFESMVPHIARTMARRGADILLVVTNDAWFKHSPAAAQHVALARLRAIENRRWLAQASNSGLTVIIDPKGRITAQSQLFAKQNIFGDIYSSNEKSFYTQYGDVFGAACVILLLAGIALVAAQGKMNLGMKDNPCGDA